MSVYSGVSGQNKDSAYRMCLRIWSAYTKYIRQQTKKDRLIDSIYFGCFYHKENVEHSTYCMVENGAFGELKFVN